MQVVGSIESRTIQTTLVDDQTVDATGQPENEQDDQGEEDRPDDQLTPVELALTSDGVGRRHDRGLEEEEKQTDQDEEDEEPDETVETDALHIHDSSAGGSGTIGTGVRAQVIASLLRNSGVHCF